MLDTTRHRGTAVSILGAATLAAVAIGFLTATAGEPDAAPAPTPVVSSLR